MPTGLKRYPQTRNLHFVTFSCDRRQTFLETSAAKDTIQELLERARRQRGFCIAAYVVMPAHLHLLTDEPAIGTLAGFLQVFKQPSSRELKASSEKQFWQRRYYDFNVHSEEKRIEKIRYIHRNPVRRGLVAQPEDYRWSSFRHYATGEQDVVEIESPWIARRREESAG